MRMYMHIGLFCEYTGPLNIHISICISYRHTSICMFSSSSNSRHHLNLSAHKYRALLRRYIGLFREITGCFYIHISICISCIHVSICMFSGGSDSRHHFNFSTSSSQAYSQVRHIFTYICIYTYMYMCVYIYIHIHIHLYIYIITSTPYQTALRPTLGSKEHV